MGGIYVRVRGWVMVRGGVRDEVRARGGVRLRVLILSPTFLE